MKRRKKKNPAFLLPAAGIATALIPAVASIFGMKLQGDAAAEAAKENARIESLRARQAEDAMRTQLTTARDQSLFQASQDSRNTQIAILAGIGGFAALMATLFVVSAMKKGK